MRKLLKILAYGLGTVILLVLIVAVTIAPAVKYYIESHSREMTGRKILIAGLHLNIFTGSAEIDSLRVYERDDITVFASVDTLALQIGYRPLLHHSIDISTLRVIGPSITISRAGGKANYADIAAKLASDTSKSSFESVILGTVQLRGGNVVYADPAGGRSVAVSVGSLNTGHDTLRLPVSAYLFDSLHLSQVVLNVVMTNAAAAESSRTAQSPAPPAKPMSLLIRRLLIDDSRCNLTDSTLISPCRVPVSGITISASDVDPRRENSFAIRASFPEGGRLDIDWKGSVADLTNQQIMLNLQNLSLPLLSPYCLQYTAYDITEGNLNFISKNIIRENNIESTNLLDAYKMNVGDKHGDLKPKINLPLGLALYLLKDKDDKISFDIPVKGNLNDPQFSYSGIILKTLVNLMVKVALSPFRFLARAFGAGGDKLENIEIDPLQTDFTAQQYRQISDVAAIEKKKPDMTLALTQYVNMKDGLRTFAVYKTKAAYLAEKFRDQQKASPTYEDITALDDGDREYGAYVDSLVLLRGVPAQGTAGDDKILSLYNTDSLRIELGRKLTRRNDILRKHVLTSYRIPAKKLIVRTADTTTLASFTDSPRYKVEMLMQGADSSTSVPGGAKKHAKLPG
ncbi:MAG TPA: DUF748 domain-containing protein [Bacteroidota bacterium]|nr:DUF748 domain-containing protein [Bacteroidota bacterium]